MLTDATVKMNTEMEYDCDLQYYIFTFRDLRAISDFFFSNNFSLKKEPGLEHFQQAHHEPAHLFIQAFG
jgi:hypothetical protein